MSKKLHISFNSPVILTFTLVSFVALLLNMLTNGYSNALLFSVYRSSPLSPFTYLRLVGHVFGHASWEHFFGNMTLFLVIGPMLEEKYGSKALMLVILTTAIFTGAIHCLLFPNVQLLGASGVVFAFILLASFTGFQSGTIPMTFLLVAFIYIGGQLYDAITLRDNISNLTHILGGGVGSAVGYFLNRR